MTNTAFNAAFQTLWAFLCDCTWAIFLVVALVVIAVHLGRKMDECQKRVTSLISPFEVFSKRSLESWRDTMFASWRLGLGALLPSGIVFGVAHNLPTDFMTSYVLDASQGFRYSQVFYFVQVLVFVSMLCVKFRALSDCHRTLNIAKESGI